MEHRGKGENMKSPLIQRFKERQSEGVKTETWSGDYHSFPSRYGDHQVGDVFENKRLIDSSPNGHNYRSEKHEVTDRIHREKCITSEIKQNLVFKDWLAATIWRLKNGFKP